MIPSMKRLATRLPSTIVSPHSESDTPNTIARIVTTFAKLIRLSISVLVTFRTMRTQIFSPQKSQRRQCNHAHPLNQIHAAHQRLRLQKINRHTPRQIARHKNPEPHTFRQIPVPAQQPAQQREKKNLVNLHGMTPNAIAKIDSP